jgi:uncharacterized damage-inducible protein DinB
MSEALSLHQELMTEVRRRLIGESLPRIKNCLAQLSTEEIWGRPNENSNSVGNLILHLTGNVRQWILTGLGGAPDVRERQQEFDERGPIPTEDLLNGITAVLHEVDELLDRLSPDDLTKKRSIQGYEESGLSVLVHVVEHFSYHVGQIAYITKAVKDIDLEFYAGQDLDQTTS